MLLMLSLCAWPAVPVQALSVHEGHFKNTQFFGIEILGEAPVSFYGKAASIVSGSLQVYQAGPFVVTEVVIDFSGSPSQLRLYATEPISAEQVVEGVRSMTGRSIPVPGGFERLNDEAKKRSPAAQVYKDYPNTTHARTIELRVSDPQEIIAFYNRFIDILTRRPATTDAPTPSGQTPNQQPTDVLLAGTLFRLEAGYQQP
jgi:hypothetical protein